MLVFNFAILFSRIVLYMTSSRSYGLHVSVVVELLGRFGLGESSSRNLRRSHSSSALDAWLWLLNEYEAVSGPIISEIDGIDLLPFLFFFVFAMLKNTSPQRELK